MGELVTICDVEAKSDSCVLGLVSAMVGVSVSTLVETSVGAIIVSVIAEVLGILETTLVTVGELVVVGNGVCVTVTASIVVGLLDWVPDAVGSSVDDRISTN
jgi:hypothetical protein